mgnify:CR=1 FL=1
MAVLKAYQTLEEAHLERMQLGAEEIQAHVLDESIASIAPHHLNGSGVRLFVADEDVPRAREILELPAISRIMPKATANPLWLMIAIGVAAFTVLFFGAKQYREPHTASVERVEQDRNNDGKLDERTEYNRQGKIVAFYADNNFDGNWDWKQSFENGSPFRAEMDRDFDDVFDTILDFKKGVKTTETICPSGQGNPLFRHEYQHGVLNVTWHDHQRDGRWDERIDHDAMGREINRTLLK